MPKSTKLAPNFYLEEEGMGGYGYSPDHPCNLYCIRQGNGIGYASLEHVVEYPGGFPAEVVAKAKELLNAFACTQEDN